MILDLITLPIRIGRCATRSGLRLTEQTFSTTIGAARWLIRAAAPPANPPPPDDMHRNGGRQPPTLHADVVIVEPRLPSTEAPPPSAPPRTVAAPRAEPVPEAAPAHLSEQAEFVESFAEPGAEEGAGAAVHVAEPWKGYRQMNADEVIDRLAGASSEELAAVTLYERLHRARQTVLDAAERRLQRASSAARRRN